MPRNCPCDYNGLDLDATGAFYGKPYQNHDVDGCDICVTVATEAQAIQLVASWVDRGLSRVSCERDGDDVEDEWLVYGHVPRPFEWPQLGHDPEPDSWHGRPKTREYDKYERDDAFGGQE
jgi:hypothetical protein